MVATATTEDAEVKDEGAILEPETTLAERGPQLPIGIETNGLLDRSIEVRPWRLKEEREIGKLRDRNKKATTFKFAALLLGLMCKKLGPHDFADKSLKSAKKQLAISQMYLGDVLYAFLWLRRETLGPILKMKLQCPRCDADFGFNADLDSVPVTAVKKVEDAKWEYTLKKPFQVRGGEAKTLTLGPVRWSSFDKLLGVGEAKVATVVGSICGLNGEEKLISEHELDEMDKVDFESILAQLDDKHVGPDMSLDLCCPTCAYTYKAPIDWGGEDFFGVAGEK